MGNLLQAINASASALDVQRARMEVAVSNLANAESTRDADGQPYRRREVVIESVPFDQHLDRSQVQTAGVRVAAVVEDQTEFRRRYEPSHPDADADGFVAVPNVDVPEEMVDMIGAARAYQANLTAINLIRDTVQKALELAK
ncbi:MAG TPA: flagellar basal body rod protein FlgC [Vicinamibacterales bacterium]|jgi:flagellar basal-body rod protein FlgC|nr:flagellar basal body rod protein FlgC [Vicinamibacterales bacterium]